MMSPSEDTEAIFFALMIVVTVANFKLHLKMSFFGGSSKLIVPTTITT